MNSTETEYESSLRGGEGGSRRAEALFLADEDHYQQERIALFVARVLLGAMLLRLETAEQARQSPANQ